MGETYTSPLASRYASPAMQRVFSPLSRYRLWRKLWLALAEAEKELGLPIADEAIDEMRAHLDDVDLTRAKELERETRHEIVAHIRAFAESAPKAAAVIHLGATSCFVTDNSELIQNRLALGLVRARVVEVLRELRRFAVSHAQTACLGFTHMQPAQPTTYGKRACLWMNDLLFDLRETETLIELLPFRGAKGATGTQASFMELFEGDSRKVERLDRRLAEKMGFSRISPVTGQTYSRKWDHAVVGALSGVAQSASKFAHDVRLLSSRNELSEPFAVKQVGSSAMAYKRNPMRSERICALARHVCSLEVASSWTASTQWLERTLDDSASRRLFLPEAFLAADAILVLYRNVCSGMALNANVVARALEREAPFLATEAILMAAVKKGGDRQVLHERIRVHSIAARERVLGGEPNDLLERLASDPAFEKVGGELGSFTTPRRLVGRAAGQVEEFTSRVLDPILDERSGLEADEASVEV